MSQKLSSDAQDLPLECSDPNNRGRLERVYTELLERRIAQLQKQLEDSQEEESSDTASIKKDEATNKDANGEKKPEKKARVRKVVSVWDYETDTRQDYEKSDAAQKPAEDGGTVFRRIMDSKDEKKLLGEELTIESQALKNLLRQNLRHIPPSQFSAKKVTILSPFRPFVWQWNELHKLCEPCGEDTQEMQEAREDLRDVLALLESSSALGSYFNNDASNKAGGITTFEYLWTIIPPGTKLYARPFMNEPQMFELHSISMEATQPGSGRSPEAYLLFAAAFDWDGVAFKPYVYGFKVPKFEGTRSVTSLPCFPVSYYQADNDEDSTKLREKLLNRGKAFYALCTQSEFQYEYTGSVSVYCKDPSEVGGEREKKITRTFLLEQSKAIVDNYSFLRSSRNEANGLLLLGDKKGAESLVFASCSCETCKTLTTTQWARKLEGLHDPHAEKELNQSFVTSPDRLLLCAPKVLGYSLQLKQWCQFAVDNLARPDSTTAWRSEDHFEETLEMDKGDKMMLKAMVQNHVNNRDGHILKDLVEGKGRGLVILLHGPPGVGKTLTAETIADTSGRPLVSVSTAEIGIEPEDAEMNLRAIFTDASRWGAVLLIDEADVFLEERKGTRDLQRNALVAVLLRVLEYYEGIIILTTNRIMSLDVAVQSRIHYAIQYRDLTRDQMQRLFERFLERVDDSRIGDRDSIYRELKAIVKQGKLNGRQIRNIVMSALLLAESEKSKLQSRHIETANDTTHKFLECLKSSTRHKRDENEAPTDY